MQPAYDLEKIKYATDAPTFEKATALYEKKKIKRFREELNGFFATVLGTKPYKVYVDGQNYDKGSCECYLGQNDVLCKHMVAVAIYAVKKGEPLTEEDKRLVTRPICSGKPGILNKGELSGVKKSISGAMRHIKAYSGPSRAWFFYQNSLSEGCNRLAKIISDLPVSEQAAKVLVNALLRLDRKLIRGGVDDSEGTVGGFIEETVAVLKEYAQLDPDCAKAFRSLENKETCFGWEEPLVMLNKKVAKN